MTRSNYSLACPAFGLKYNVTDSISGSFVTTGTRSCLNTTEGPPYNLIYTYEGSIIADQTGQHTIRLAYGYSTSATLKVEDANGSCVLDESCYLPANLTCNTTNFMATNYYFRFVIQFEILGPCPNNYIRLEWKRPGDSNFGVIPAQNLCQSVFASGNCIL